MIDKKIQKILKTSYSLSDKEFNFIIESCIDIKNLYNDEEILMALSILIFKLGKNINHYIK